MGNQGAWAVILHGGCKPIRADQVEANRAGLNEALAAAVGCLEAGGSALDAAEAAVVAMEDDPIFNAGRGSVRRADGSVEMDAAVMDGDTLAIGGVCLVREVQNPVRLARRHIDGPETLLARPDVVGPSPGPTPQTAPVGGDTVGCVALDVSGRIAVAVSTGGLGGARPGRIGDTPLPGCGFYADSHVGGVAATGVGESISRTLLSARTILALEAGRDPQAAVEAALVKLESVGGEAGLIALDRSGRLGWSHSGDQFAVGWALGPSPILHIAIEGLEGADG